MTNTKLVSVADFAASYPKKDGSTGVNKEYIYMLIKTGKLKAVKFGKITLIEMEATK